MPDRIMSWALTINALLQQGGPECIVARPRPVLRVDTEASGVPAHRLARPNSQVGISVPKVPVPRPAPQVLQVDTAAPAP